jgi:hypothetical protein
MTAADRMTCADAIDVAKRWTARGVPAFPIAIAWDNKKQATNKWPLTEHGHLDATTDPGALERLFNAKSPGPGAVWGIGLSPGPAGYAVVDIDVKRGAGGDDTWAALKAEHGDVDTYTATTPTNGATHQRRPHLGTQGPTPRPQRPQPRSRHRRPRRRRLDSRPRHPYPVGNQDP